MAQALDAFEELAQDHLPPDVADEIKGIFRRKMHALALDACEVISLRPGEEMNLHAVELRDRLHVEGRRPTQRSTTA